MIAHISIPASRPEEIAKFLAKVIGGEAFPFPSVKGAWIIFQNDGSAIEVYPLGTVGKPGTAEEPVQSGFDPEQKMFSAHHVAVSTKLSKEEIKQLAHEMNFRSVACERSGLFEVVEVWIENQFLIEVLTEGEFQRYKNNANAETFKRMMNLN